MTNRMPLSQAMLLAVGRTLSDRRAAGARITDTALAAALGTSKNTVGRRLRGEIAITPDEFELFADALGVSVDDLWDRARRIRGEPIQSDDSARAELLAGLSPRNRKAVEGLLSEPETEAPPEIEMRHRRSS